MDNQFKPLPSEKIAKYEKICRVLVFVTKVTFSIALIISVIGFIFMGGRHIEVTNDPYSDALNAKEYLDTLNTILPLLYTGCAFFVISIFSSFVSRYIKKSKLSGKDQKVGLSFILNIIGIMLLIFYIAYLLIFQTR